MIQAPAERLTFEEYCNLDNGDRYELVNGELVEMPPVCRGEHALIIDALNDQIISQTFPELALTAEQVLSGV